METSTPQDTAPANATGAAGGARTAGSVPTRRVSFEDSLAELPVHFAADGDLILSHFFATLSSVFPDGEEYFVRSVRHHRDRVDDPTLRRQVAGFIGQESVHGREHRVLNDRLAELGYPTQRYERLTRWALTTRERIVPPIGNLAATAAMEHFTATLAELALTDDEARRLPGPVVGDVFTWHALEESEHKAVAFDVYRAAGGSERLRIWTMKLLRIGLVVGISFLTAMSLLGDRATYRPGRLRRSWVHFRRTPMFRREVWDQLCDYDRVGFHPDDSDTEALVETWRHELFGDEGRLTPLLAGGAREGSAR